MHRGRIVQKRVLSMSISAGLNASDENEWFHFQGNSLPSWDAFSEGAEFGIVRILHHLQPNRVMQSAQIGFPVKQSEDRDIGPPVT